MNITTLIPQNFELLTTIDSEINSSKIAQPIIPSGDTPTPPIVDDNYLMASNSVVLQSSSSESFLWTNTPQILVNTL